jgi:predicted ATPase
MTKCTNDFYQITRLVFHGYKSIAECDLKMRRLNILIGANGAGKTNFIDFFRFVSEILNQRLQKAVGVAGGPDSLLHFGRKQTEEMDASFYFGATRYMFALSPTDDNKLIFQQEIIGNIEEHEISSFGYLESQAHLYDTQGGANKLDAVIRAIKNWKIYHFHDTGKMARVKQVHNINDNEYLRDDARNLAAFLFRLRSHHGEHYRRIVKTIQLVAPFFGDFHLRPTVDNKLKIQLEWTEKGQDEPFTASALSDGTLRFICLAAVLLQPQEYMPAVILIDEPELGLHPFAIGVLAGLMRSVSQNHQLIVSTQSVELVNEFDAEDLVVVDKRDGASVFKRLDTEALREWLADYSLGELWKKNLLGGRP